MPFRLIFIYFLTFSGMKGAFNSPGFLFFPLVFCLWVLESQFLCADINISIILALDEVVVPQILLLFWKKDLFKVHLIVPFLVMSIFQNRIFCPNFKKMQNDRPGRLALTIFFKLVQKWTKKYISSKKYTHMKIWGHLIVPTPVYQFIIARLGLQPTPYTGNVFHREEGNGTNRKLETTGACAKTMLWSM